MPSGKGYSCHGCKFLYKDGQGYSDYTWEETFLTCALNRNPALPIQEPWGYNDDMTKTLRWMATFAFECEKREPGDMVTVTPDGNISEGTNDREQMRAIIGHQRDYRYECGEKVTDEDLDKCLKHETVHGGQGY